MTQDPFPGLPTRPQTLNPYPYVLNNPINLTDPSGEFALIPLLLVGAVGGALGGLGYYAIKTVANPCIDWDWEKAVFWTGAGTVIGAAISGGIYGGWWIGAQAGWWGTAAAGGASAWSSPWYGRQIINGIEYTVHALERMMPSGYGGRGVPPAVVENAIRFGTKFPGREPGTIVHVYENIRVVTDALSKIVITVIKTGH